MTSTGTNAHLGTRDVRAGRYAVGVLMLANVSALMDRQILGLLVAPIKRDFQISDTQLSLLMGLAFTVFYAILAVPAARISDLRGRRLVIATGVSIWSLMTVLCGRASSYPAFFLARLGVGVGEATLIPGAVALISDAFPAERRGAAVSFYSIGTYAGSGIAYILGGTAVATLAADTGRHWPMIGDVRPWQAVFIFIGAPGLLIAALVATIREPVSHRTGGGALTIIMVLRALKPHAPAMVLVGLALGLSQAVNYGIAGWIPTFFVRTYGWTAGHAGIVQGALTGTFGVVGVVAGGRWSDRLTRLGILDAPLRVVGIGALGMILFAGAYPLMPTANAAVGLLAAVNVFAALPWGAAAAGVASMAPRQYRAQTTALIWLIVSLVSGITGPTSVAFLSDHVFRGADGVRYALAVVPVGAMSVAIVLLISARKGYIRAVTAAAQGD